MCGVVSRACGPSEIAGLRIGASARLNPHDPTDPEPAPLSMAADWLGRAALGGEDEAQPSRWLATLLERDRAMTGAAAAELAQPIWASWDRGWSCGGTMPHHSGATWWCVGQVFASSPT